MHNRASYTCYIIKKKTINKTKMLISLKKTINFLIHLGYHSSYFKLENAFAHSF